MHTSVNYSSSIGPVGDIMKNKLRREECSLAFIKFEGS